MAGEGAITLADFGVSAPSPTAQNQFNAQPIDTPESDSPDVSWPYDDPGSWDTLYLGGTWPGLATVKIKGGQKIDRKSAKGSHGETITYQGRKASDIDITIRIWQSTPDEFSWLQEMIALIEPIPGKKDPTPFDIYHPVCAIRHVTSVAIEEIDGPDWDGEKGFMTISIKAIEYVPPPPQPATVTPKGAVGTTQWQATTPQSASDGDTTSTNSPTDTAAKKQVSPPSKGGNATSPGT